ncbi:MAG: polyribonucleotide nucleotidyltransferase [bacterium]
MTNEKTVQMQLSGKNLIIQNGILAKQASGAVTVQYGDTVILATVVASPGVRKDIDFFPLTVDYREKMYAAGKIPGGFFKREGRPREKEILTSRIIDRPLRPLFPKGFKNEVQIMVSVLSTDCENDADVLSIIGSSCALAISGIPFNGPVGAVRVGRVDGSFVINPTFQQLENSDIDLVIAGTKAAIIMVEGAAREIGEEVMGEALDLGYKSIQDIIKLQEDMVKEVLKDKKTSVEYTIEKPDPKIDTEVRAFATAKVKEALSLAKDDRKVAMGKLLEEVLAQFEEKFPESSLAIKAVMDSITKDIVRQTIIKTGKRVDGRGLGDIRSIDCKVGVLPRTHGSGLFTRGGTQALVATTLGTPGDKQIMDELEKEYKKRFMLHYNFPPFSTGEVRPNRGVGRREIGHGILAERSLMQVLPSDEEFPYTIRLVSDILESDGSSSMASICGSTLALMDAGVPIKTPIAGIAMGVIVEGEKSFILTDILGLEDHCGDMDFKVAGSSSGITAFQMDVKIEGVTIEIVKNALEDAKKARLFILDKMTQSIGTPRESLSAYAPKIVTIQIKTDKIRDVIGPGGKIIKKIIETTGVDIDINDDGKIYIAAVDSSACEKAQQMIADLVADAEVGKVYKGRVTRIMNFGAFVEVLPGKEGLVHISQLDHKRVAKVEDVVHEGDEITVKVIEIDDKGRVNLSRKAVLKKQ